jgi:3-oxoacyl-[acyl-carrier protein] reductase
MIQNSFPRGEEEMENQALKGKCAVVTGASSGIGRAIAIALAREGAGVVIASRGKSGKKDALLAIREEIQASGGKALAVKADVSREENVKRLVEKAVEEFGRVDILVNNAAIFPHYHSYLVDYPVETWDQTMAINLRGPFLCLKAVLPGMIKQRSGCIINISSIAAVRAGKGRIAYGVSKAGLERLTFGLADEVREYNIAVNVLSPIGLTDTPSARETFRGENMERWVQPEDMAEAAVWLARQTASTFTGNAVMVPPHGQRTIFVYGRGQKERSWQHID